MTTEVNEFSLTQEIEKATELLVHAQGKPELQGKLRFALYHLEGLRLEIETEFFNLRRRVEQRRNDIGSILRSVAEEIRGQL